MIAQHFDKNNPRFKGFQKSYEKIYDKARQIIPEGGMEIYEGIL